MEKTRERKSGMVKYCVSLLCGQNAESPNLIMLRGIGKAADVWAGLLIMCPDGQSCLQADCSYCTVQSHLLADMMGAKADKTSTSTFKRERSVRSLTEHWSASDSQ